MINNTTFKKGEEFEHYVEQNLFVESDYDLVHRTNSFEQNKVRFSENSMKPDFKFRCRKTLIEFYVEAKYRSNFNSKDKIEVISFQQLERFRKIQESENIKVFIVVGFEGVSTNPVSLSLIPLDELIHLQLYRSFLKNFIINKSVVGNEILKLNKSVNNEKDESDIDLVKTNTQKNNKFKIAIYTTIIAVFSIFIFYFLNDSTEDVIKKKTAEYYLHVENGNIDALENYIAPKVNTWYDKSNLTFDQIRIETSNYLKKYPNSSTTIQWDTFKFYELGQDYLCVYDLVYKIKSSGKLKNKTFHLRINAVWGKDLKLKSIKEKKL